MATHVFHGFSPSAWVIEGGGPSVSVGSKMMVDPEWSASTDAYEFSVTDADASFEGDDLNDGVGNDSTQQVLVKDAGGATLYDAKGYLENSFTLDDGNGTVVTVYDVYVGTTYVGSIADGPITPGVSWEITSIDNVTGANAPDYTSVEDQDFEQGIANTMEGGAHNDSLLGGAGSDTLDVGGGTANSAAGGSGNDTIYGGTGSDTLLGESGEDEIWGDGGNDSIDGGSGNDLLGGDAGDDTILGQGGLDTIYGGTGHDYIDGGTEDDSIEGGIGNDTVLGGVGSDTISGDAGNDSIEGGTGDDMLFGNEGDDTLFFGLGNDTVYGGDGNDSIDDAFGELTDVYSSYLDGGAGSDTIHAGGGSDTLIGGGDNDQLWGEQGNDSLDGGAGSDELRGGAGDDTIVGGAGDDSLRSGDGYDTFKFSDGSGSDTIHDFDMGDDDSNGLTNDQFDVTTLLDSGALPVNFDDVVVSDDGSGNAVLTFPNGEAVTLIGVAPAQVDGRDEMHSIGIPCFADGTRILTPAGEVLVEELRAGDRICTMHHGVQPILWAGKRRLSEADLDADPRLRPLRIRDGTLGNRGDLLVSAQHAMLVPRAGPLNAQMSNLLARSSHPHGQLIRATHLLEHGGWPRAPRQGQARCDLSSFASADACGDLCQLRARRKPLSGGLCYGRI